MFGRKDEQPQEHTITQSWRPGPETLDYVKKIHRAECTCGWVSPEGDFELMARASGAHDVAAERGTRTPGLTEFAGVG